MFTALVLVAGGASAGGIGLFSQPDGSNCNLTLPNYVATPIYVLYLGQGSPQATGAEYSITGMPGTPGVNYIATLVNAPGSVLNLGNAFDGVGHNVAWPTPQPFDGNGNLLCATYSMLALGAVPAGTVIRVFNRTPPTNAAFECPLITDAGFDLFCQSGGEMHVNGTGNTCQVAVESRTWTGVRQLFR
jgi:hypothetical protein